MASGDTHDPPSEETGDPMTDAGGDRPALDDALSRLEERLDRASQAAERLLADAAERVTGGRDFAKPPPAGWQQPASEEGPGGLLGADGDLLLGLLATVRDRIPPELQQRLAEAVREVLLALRALIDWYLERSERSRPGGTDVEDIPIL
jgi:hypothetical protein